MRRKCFVVLTALFCFLFFASKAFSQQLEIHYVNVGWGTSVLVKGPDGTTVLMEAGNTGDGTNELVPYLQSIGILPGNGLDYTIVGHQHCDHLGGMDEVINAGYDVHVKNYYNGSSNTTTCVTQWNGAAATTTAGAPEPMPVETVIPLGNGAKLTAIAVNGSIIGGGSVSVSNENDRSIAVLIQYGGFDYLWASDLGGGNIDQDCTGRFTSSQTDVETSIIQTISPGGASPMISSGGIDVLHVNHHGSESSTNKNWMNMSMPAVAVIAVGAGQSTGWSLPRKDVVENVLLAQATACITVPAAFVLQTEEGAPTGSRTSFAGFSVGNIRITTDGQSTFTVSADGQVNQGPNEVLDAELPRTFDLDEVTGPDTEAPTTSITSPSDGATVSGTLTVTASASDNVGVTKVEFKLDDVLQSTDTAAPYSWSWDTTTASNGVHTLTSVAHDAAGLFTVSAPVSVTVNNPPGLDISNWKVVQANSSRTFFIPAGTSIPENGYVIIGRNATKAQFEALWLGGAPLPSNVVYINSTGSFPVINGKENYTLYDAAGRKVDGRTIRMDAGAGDSIQRKDPCLNARKRNSWKIVSATSATPGSGAGTGCGTGVVINEFSDALGTGNFTYEFVELHYDK